MIQSTLSVVLTGRSARWLPIVLSSAVFSMGHQHLGWSYALASFVPGLFWGWMYQRQRSLIGVSISHALIGVWACLLDLFSIVS